MTQYSVRDDYAPRFGRQVLSLWSGSFASDHEGYAVELPRHDGFMVTAGDGPRPAVRVACESPRTDENYVRVDAVIADALAALVAGRVCGIPPTVCTHDHAPAEIPEHDCWSNADHTRTNGPLGDAYVCRVCGSVVAVG